MEYTIQHLDPQTNTLVARQETALHAVSLSGGLGSALAAERVIRRYGRKQVLLWFADVLDEDADLYRFLYDLMGRWGGRLYWYTDGRRPADVWEQKKIIPNNLIAPCSYELKVKPFRAFIQAMPALPRVYIGYKAHETRRCIKTCVSYAKAIPEAVVEYPLRWDPVETRDLAQVCQDELGIRPPLAYTLGFDYNNCLGGGGCCRSGIGAWTRIAFYWPDRFARREQWEQEARAQGGARANRSFAARTRGGCKEPLTLAQIREEYLPLLVGEEEDRPQVCKA